jgi:hypothetical protein
MSFVAGFLMNLDAITASKKDGRYWFKPLYPDQTGPTGLIGSVADMSIFMNALLAVGEAGDPVILSAGSLRELWTPHIDVDELPAVLPPNAHFGLGWVVFDIDGESTIAHGGAGMGFVSQLWLQPGTKRGVFVVGNSTYLDGAGGGNIAKLAMTIR